MYGWRARIGLLVPCSNSVAEIEFARMAPEGVSVHTGRVWQQEPSDDAGKAAALLDMAARAPQVARELAEVRPAIIVWACTSASFAAGPGSDLESARAIAEASGVPAITTSTAVTLALRALGAQRIGMATPYIEDIAQRERHFFETVLPGLRIVRNHNLGLRANLPKGELFPEETYRAARLVDGPEVEAIFISCTNWRAIEVIEPLERDLGKPVIASNQASMWAALGRLGIAGPRGFGRLFDLPLPAAQPAGALV
jgi:maleate isomerase